LAFAKSSLFVLGLAGLSNAQAADAGLAGGLDEIVVTATRTERAAAEVPYVSHVLDSYTLLHHKQARTLPEALRGTPGILVQKTGHGQGSPFIRGFTGFRTLFLIDGIRLNNSVFRDGPNQYWNTIDPFTIDRMEIVKGPSSVLYGSDAVGGTVNALLLSGQRAPQSDGATGRMFYRFADGEDAGVGRAQFGYRRGDLSFLLGYSVKDFGDLESGAGVQPQTGYQERDADFKMEYRLGEGQRLILAHQQLEQDDAWRTHRTVFAQPFRGTSIGSARVRALDQNRDLTYLQYHGEGLDGLVSEWHASLSLQQQSERRFRVRGDGRSDRQGFDVSTAGLSIQGQSTPARGLWVYGLEYYQDSVDSFRRDFDAEGVLTSTAIQGPVADDARYGLLGIYVERQLPIGAHWELIPGIRHTYASADADRVLDPVTGGTRRMADNWGASVGSLRVRYQVERSSPWNFFGGISEGFRAPNLSDLTRFDSARTNEIETPVASLEPEAFVSYELGAKLDTPQGWAQMAFYYTDIDGMIVRTPTGAVIDGDFEVTKRNSGKGYTKGIELEGAWHFSRRWSLVGAFTWMDGAVDTFPTSAPTLVTEPIDRMMPVTTTVGLQWQDPSERYWLEASLVDAQAQDELSTRDRSDASRIPPGGTPGYTVLHLRSSWRISDTLRLAAAVENVTDQNYRVHGSGLNETGRNLVVTLDWQLL